MRIAIDAMGGDHAPDDIVEGVVEAATLLPEAKLLLVGQRERIAREGMPPNVEIVHASQVVGMDEKPLDALRGKPDSSLRVTLRMVKRGEADGAISAGNTGALVGGATVPMLGLGNLEGVKRPGIAVPMPTAKGSCALIDAGANPNAKPDHLIQYAVMGSVFIKYLHPEIERPRVGLLNIGEEPEKGTELLRKTYQILEKGSWNFEFMGNIEPHGLFEGMADVAVCDGFVGNLALKTAEGVRELIFKVFANGLSTVPGVGEGAKKAAEKFDYTSLGGAPVLGVRGIVIKAHGRSRSLAITNAVKLASGFIGGKLNDHLVEELRKYSSRSTSFSKWFTWSKEGE